MHQARRHNEEDNQYFENEVRRQFAAEERVDERNKIDGEGHTRDEDRQHKRPAPYPEVLLRRFARKIDTNKMHKDEIQWQEDDKRCHRKTNRTRVRIDISGERIGE